MTPPPTQIQKLHSLYNGLTRFNLSMRYDRERSWYEFIRAGFTAEDLRLVITHLKAGIRRKERHSGCLKFSNLIEPLNFFEEERELARNSKALTKPAPNDKEKVIQLFRPVVTEPVPKTPVKSTGSIIPKLLEELRKAAR